MANELRARGNLVSGTLSGALTSVATTMTAAGLANLPIVDTTNHAAITIENEIVWVTAHTVGATTATIVRGQEGTTAAAHNSGVAWVHGPTTLDAGLLTTGSFATWTPVLRQNAATVTANVLIARYTKIDRLVFGYVSLKPTANGASGVVDISLPVSARDPAVEDMNIGAGLFFDSSAAKRYNVVAEVQSGFPTTMYFLDDINNATLGIGLALGIGDILRIDFTYEAAT